MTAVEFEARIVAWAQARQEVTALVLGGSRARVEARPDDRADWDFHLITTEPRSFHGTGWLEEIAPCWCAHAGVTPRGVVKVSAVFAEGWEVDFVPLASWQMKLVFAAMRRPGWAAWMPERLRRGIGETRAFLLGSGHRVLKGGAAWERRLEAVRTAWPAAGMPAGQFAGHGAAFWPQAVWLAKRIGRAETRSAVLWHSRLMLEQVYPLLAEEARLAGRTPRPEARKAEQWLSAERLPQTAIAPGLTPAEQARALRATIDLFSAVARSVAKQRGFPVATPVEAEQWLRGELERLAQGGGR